MRMMNTRNFRTAFATLTEPVTVIRREKVLGVFYPGDPAGEVGIATTYDHPVRELTAKEAQANRDAILRRVNHTRP